MGHGVYKGGADHYHSITENVRALPSKFGLSPTGYFGIRGKSGKNWIRNFESSNPLSDARTLYDALSHGGIEAAMSNGKGLRTSLSDGSIVSMRQISHSDGSPVVEINIEGSSDPAGVARQKIHFVRRRG